MMTSNLTLFKSVANIFIFLFQAAIFPICFYYMIISMFGWFKRKETAATEYIPVNRFAVIIAAHNEETVIGNIVRNLKNVDYPKELYDIFVVADNCSDNTAEIARQNGAEVCERFDDTKKGKGFALKWMFEKLFEMDGKYDAVCVFDADNLVSANFLLEMNKHLCIGHKVIQGYVDGKNSEDTFISGNYSITYWLTNRLIQLPRYYAGLSCSLLGKGFVVATDILKEMGWDATCLTEDCEFTILLVLKGMKVYWAHDAVVYDENPLTLAQSWGQRKRWIQGYAYCTCRYLKDLMLKTFRDRDIVAFDCAMYVLWPLVLVMNSLGLFSNILKSIMLADSSRLLSIDTLFSALVLFIFTYISFVFVIAEGKLSKKIIGYFLASPFYNITWIPIIIQGFINKDKKEWIHTLHTRSIDISDMKKIEKIG